VTKVCFLDNDIIRKLIAFGLFEEAIAILQITKADLQVLPTAKFVLDRERKKQKLHTPEVWTEIMMLVESCSTISKTTEDFVKTVAEEESQLAPFKDSIHEGEAALIFATRGTIDFLLLSGDKKFMKALALISNTTIYNRLCGRVICLEQFVLKLIEVKGFSWVKERVLPERDCDRALKACFGSGEQATEDNVSLTLISYIKEITDAAPNLLMNL
jgi:hypothetical protein